MGGWNRRRTAARAGLLALATAGHAEAGGYPAGTGSVTIAYQHIDNTGHRLSDGSLLEEGQSVSQALMCEVRYGLTARLTLAAGLPYVAARYTGAGPTPFQFLPVDADRRWHGSLQDIAVSARYELAGDGALSVRPGVSVVVPSHAYAYRGEAVVGRRLAELQLSLAVSRVLDGITPRLSVDGSYSYAAVQKGPVAIRNDRSNATLGLGYRLTPKLDASASGHWQRTHGGLRLGSIAGPLLFPGEVDTAERIVEHDRLLRDDYVHLEGALTLSAGPFDISSSYLHYLSGTDTHAGRAITIGVTWFFRAGEDRAGNP